MLSGNRCSSNSILHFDNFDPFYNKLIERIICFCKFLEDMGKGVRFYKAAALQPIYLLKRTLLLQKILIVMLKF